MTISSLLFKERIITLRALRSKPQLKGFLRIIKKNDSETVGFFLDKETFAELFETTQYSHPKFWKEIDASRKSGRVSAKRIEKELKIK